MTPERLLAEALRKHWIDRADEAHHALDGGCESCGASIREVLANSPALRAALAPAAGLDAAWKAAEDALPEGWRMSLVGPYSDGRWVATAHKGATEGRAGKGPTPTAALLALAEALRVAK